MPCPSLVVSISVDGQKHGLSKASHSVQDRSNQVKGMRQAVVHPMSVTSHRAGWRAGPGVDVVHRLNPHWMRS